MYRSRSYSPRSPSPEPSPRPPKTHRHSRRHSSKSRGYAIPGDRPSRRGGKVELKLCIFHTTSHKWSTEPFTFDPRKINDRELWTEIRDIFRTDLQKPWRRILGVKKVQAIVPIGYTPNGVPVRTDPKDYPDSKSFMHAYHHPDEVRPEHEWVDFFVRLDRSDERQNGLEFVEGLWAQKLAAIAIGFSIAIVTTSIVWCILGGNLQTVFTVMSFVLTLVAAQIALAALYYQVALPNS